MRRDQDTVNPRTHADIMVLSHEDEERERHPYWYGRVVHVLHVFVQTRNILGILSPAKRMDVLWVRWFGRNPDRRIRAGWKAKRLYQVGFLPINTPGAFGFLDPDLVIRGVHMIPRFSEGKTNALLPPSIIRPLSHKDEDWRYFYVGM